LTAATDTTVRFTGGTYTDVQLELGSIPTAFERASHGEELALCQRYYWTGFVRAGGTNSNAGGSIAENWIAFPAQMRAAPVLAALTATSLSDAVSITADTPKVSGFRVFVQSVTTIGVNFGASATAAADAEL
jgi:hypothetical protein